MRPLIRRGSRQDFTISLQVVGRGTADMQAVAKGRYEFDALLTSQFRCKVADLLAGPTSLIAAKPEVSSIWNRMFERRLRPRRYMRPRDSARPRPRNASKREPLRRLRRVHGYRPRTPCALWDQRQPLVRQAAAAADPAMHNAQEPNVASSSRTSEPAKTLLVVVHLQRDIIAQAALRDVACMPCICATNSNSLRRTDQEYRLEALGR